MAVFILPYKMASISAKGLADSLGVKRLKHDTIRYNTPRNDTIINWGNSAINFNPVGSRIINQPNAVSKATDKLQFFRALQDATTVRTVPFTTEANVAREWDKVIVRTLTRASEGRGIVVCNRGDELPRAPLYTKYTPKVAEYRVHVLNGRAFDTQRKIKDPNRSDVTDFNVRNTSNGFIFARNSGKPSEQSVQMAVECVRLLGLDFGAVDLIENKSGTYILEVNTAPGLEGTTYENYTKAFREYLRL